MSGSPQNGSRSDLTGMETPPGCLCDRDSARERPRCRLVALDELESRVGDLLPPPGLVADTMAASAKGRELGYAAVVRIAIGKEAYVSMTARRY